MSKFYLIFIIALTFIATVINPILTMSAMHLDKRQGMFYNKLILELKFYTSRSRYGEVTRFINENF